MKLVIVIGARPQINRAVRERGAEPQYAHGYRVTDPASLQVRGLERSVCGSSWWAEEGRRLNAGVTWGWAGRCDLPRGHSKQSDGHA